MCGQPVLGDKSAYVGEYRAQTMSLLLDQDGSAQAGGGVRGFIQVHRPPVPGGLFRA
jgi:hypothetical protein